MSKKVDAFTVSKKYITDTIDDINRKMDELNIKSDDIINIIENPYDMIIFYKVS